MFLQAEADRDREFAHCRRAGQSPPRRSNRSKGGEQLLSPRYADAARKRDGRDAIERRCAPQRVRITNTDKDNAAIRCMCWLLDILLADISNAPRGEMANVIRKARESWPPTSGLVVDHFHVPPSRASNVVGT